MIYIVNLVILGDATFSISKYVFSYKMFTNCHLCIYVSISTSYMQKLLRHFFDYGSRNDHRYQRWKFCSQHLLPSEETVSKFVFQWLIHYMNIMQGTVQCLQYIWYAQHFGKWIHLSSDEMREAFNSPGPVCFPLTPDGNGFSSWTLCISIVM